MAHRILLLNFTKAEAATLAAQGYTVERGFLGPYRSSPKSFPFRFPHPIYEYDVLFYNSEIPAAITEEFINPQNLLSEPGLYRTLSKFNGPPYARVSFIGRSIGTGTLIEGGVSFVEMANAEENLSSFVEGHDDTVFAIGAVGRLLAGFKGQIATVAKFFSLEGNIYPFNHFPVITSRSGGVVAAYGTTFGKTTLPRYILLPQLKNNAQAMIQILKCLEETWPELFPDRIRRDWINGEQFLLPEERAIEAEIEGIMSQTKSLIESKRKEREQLAAQNAFIRNLLVATERTDLDISERLSTVVKKALEFLDFRVEDIDQKTRSAIKKEDFWVIDGEFLAITEVTGTGHKNPKVKEFNDILGRMATIYKRKGDLVLPDAATLSGLLVLNYDIDTHPANRPRAYAAEDEHIVETAAEQGIGLLSTVELHKIVVAVKEERLTKVAARQILRRPGRIEFGSSSK
jgi:hypothetical protein